MNIRDKMVQLASHCYAMGHIDGEQGKETEDKELEGVVDNFWGEDQPNEPDKS